MMDMFLFLTLYPSPPMPNAFQRSLFMAGKPPAAKYNLQKEDRKADKQAYGIAAIGRQVKPEGEINNSADNGLADIVC